MTVAEIQGLVASRLPHHYEDLKLTFYGEGSQPRGGYVVIGDDYGTDLCAAVADGVVYSIDPEDELPTRFVNSSIEQLARSIAASQSFAESTLDGQALSHQMRQALTAIDPRALSEPSSWWGAVLEGVALGL